MMITQTIRRTFEDRGIVYIKNFLPTEKVSHAQQAVRQHLERGGIWQDGAWNLSTYPSSNDIGAGKELVTGLKKCQAFIDLFDGLQEPITEQLDGQFASPVPDYPSLLFTLPNATSWSVSSQNWHLDSPRISTGGIPGIQVFTFLETVVPGGGGTLAVAGFHRLLNDQGWLRSKQVIDRLKKEPYFRSLLSKDHRDRQHFLREPGHVNEIEVQVVEMVGEPGDVFLMDMRIVHTIAANASHTPRVMLTQRYVLESARAEVYGGEH